jgi:hypothetical protein
MVSLFAWSIFGSAGFETASFIAGGLCLLFLVLGIWFLGDI